MKKKQTRRTVNPETKDNTSSCSDDERMKFVTRSSARKKKVSVSSARSSNNSQSMADSAYEADDSARSDTSPPKHQPMDEYRIEAIDDVPVVSKTRKRKNTSQAKQTNKVKKSTKPKTNLNMSTSTPVFEGTKSREDANCQLVTPEVTPILSDGNHNMKCNIVDIHGKNLSTPTLRRSLRKRSFSFQDPDLSAISAQLSFDSQADSGIVISPPVKKVKPSRSVAVDSNSNPQSSSELLKDNRTKKLAAPCKRDNYSIKGKAVLRESAMNSSCFGFDSIQTPSPVSRPKKSRRLPLKQTKLSKKAYRSPVKNLSDSLFDDSPGRDSNSSPANTDSQENLVCHPSPSLFSDEMFSDDGAPDQPIVNKVSNKSYKGFSAKIKKSKPQVSKIDAWASSFNTELESIEKFDLNIE